MYFSKIVVDRFGKQLYILAIKRRGNENNNVQNVWQRKENLNNCAKFKTVISECMGNFHNLWVFHFSCVMHQKEIVHRGYLLIRTTISSCGMDWQRQLRDRGSLGDAPTVRPRIQ